MNPDMLYFALIPAAGVGTRMGGDIPKQYMMLAGKTILEHSIDRFLSHAQVNKIIVVINSHDKIWPTLPISKHEKVIAVTGAATRAESVLRGLLHLQNIAQPQDWILVHDAVRPCLHTADIDKLINALRDHPVGGILATPEPNTLKRIAVVEPTINKLQATIVTETIHRENIWQALTPQMFRFAELLSSIQVALAKNKMITDDSQALELMSKRHLIVEGRRDNIKITYPDDLELAKIIFQQYYLPQ